MKSIANLSNHVQANVSFRALAKLKRLHPRLFTSPTLFYRALHTLSSNHHRLPIRRFVFDLFSLQLSPTTVTSLLAAERTLRRTTAAADSPAMGGEAPEAGEKAKAVKEKGLRRGSRQRTRSASSGESEGEGEDEASEEGTKIGEAEVREPGRRVVGFSVAGQGEEGEEMEVDPEQQEPDE